VSYFTSTQFQIKLPFGHPLQIWKKTKQLLTDAGVNKLVLT